MHLCEIKISIFGIIPCEINDVADSLAARSSHLTYEELTQYKVDGLDDDYKTFIIAATHVEGKFTFNDLGTKLILYEPRVL